MPFSLHRRPTDRRQILDVMAESAGPLTTAQPAAATRIELHRCARAVALMVEEHLLEHAVRKNDGWAWSLTDVGTAERGREIAAETGERFDSSRDVDESILAANLRRQGLG